MKRYSAQYVFTNNGPVLKRGIVSVEEDGTVIDAVDNGGTLDEAESVEFHNGILIPGFVNCHCHTELSHLKGLMPSGTGLVKFLALIGKLRETDNSKIEKSIRKADGEMFTEGIVLCADICNSPGSFSIKTGSRIKYINLLEVFGIDPDKAEKRIGEIVAVSKIAESLGISWWIVPHSVYSISLPLFTLIRERSATNKITSIHYLESAGEEQFLRDHTGSLVESYRELGLLNGVPVTVTSHSSAILDQVTTSGNLILVHNTYADLNSVRGVKVRNNLYWCLCPNANIYIENHLPPAMTLMEENCEIVIGTDSLASNHRLSILEEIKTLQFNFPSISLEELIKWATLNGARALGEEDMFGSLEPGKKPGLLLIEDIDLQNMKLLPESRVRRLI